MAQVHFSPAALVESHPSEQALFRLNFPTRGPPTSILTRKCGAPRRKKDRTFKAVCVASGGPVGDGIVRVAAGRGVWTGPGRILVACGVF